MSAPTHRVAHIIAPGPIAGAEQVVSRGAAALHQRGALHSLILIDEVRAGSPAQRMAEEVAALGVPVKLVTSKSRLDLALLGQLHAAASGATLLHAHGPKALVYARAITGGRPLVATHHGELSRTGAERAYELLQRSLYASIDAVCCVSQAQRIQLQRAHPHIRCAVIENFAREARPAPELPQRPFWLFAGRISEEKGLDLLLQAIHHSGAATPLLVAGDGPHRGCMEALAKSLGLGDEHVRFLGWRDDAPALIAAASAVIIPSRREGMPMIALEARVAGTPIVAAMVGGLPEVVTHGEGGLLVPSSDVEALAQTLRRLEREGDALREQAQAKAPEAQRRFSLDTWTARTLALYDSIAPRP